MWHLQCAPAATCVVARVRVCGRRVRVSVSVSVSVCVCLSVCLLSPGASCIRSPSLGLLAAREVGEDDDEVDEDVRGADGLGDEALAGLVLVLLLVGAVEVVGRHRAHGHGRVVGVAVDGVADEHGHEPHELREALDLAGVRGVEVRVGGRRGAVLGRVLDDDLLPLENAGALAELVDLALLLGVVDLVVAVADDGGVRGERAEAREGSLVDLVHHALRAALVLLELPELDEVTVLNVERVDEQDGVDGHVPDDQRHQEGHALRARRQAEEVRVEHRAPGQHGDGDDQQAVVGCEGAREHGEQRDGDHRDEHLEDNRGGGTAHLDAEGDLELALLLADGGAEYVPVRAAVDGRDGVGRLLRLGQVQHHLGQVDGVGDVGDQADLAGEDLHVKRVLVHVPARRLGRRDDDLLLQEELLGPRAHHGAFLVARRDDGVGRGVHHLEVVGVGDGLVGLLQHRGRRHPPVRRRDQFAIGADALARVVEVDRARVHGIAVGPRDRVLELDLEGVEGHQRHLLDGKVAHVDGEVLGQRRVAEGLGGAVVARQLLPVEGGAASLHGAREVWALSRGREHRGQRAARFDGVLQRHHDDLLDDGGHGGAQLVHGGGLDDRVVLEQVAAVALVSVTLGDDRVRGDAVERVGGARAPVMAHLVRVVVHVARVLARLHLLANVPDELRVDGGGDRLQVALRLGAGRPTALGRRRCVRRESGDVAPIVLLHDLPRALVVLALAGACELVPLRVALRAGRVEGFRVAVARSVVVLRELAANLQNLKRLPGLLGDRVGLDGPLVG
mmetsp:Transcript_41785/g.100530  ORF Transcript_41785/g.100530 Transcript_41785/m.100530 type:complete len:789 (+) Transcript_41785:62-2428(+)